VLPDMARTLLDGSPILALLCTILYAVHVQSSDTPIATQAIITTLTETATKLSALTVGISTSTIVSECPDGTCAAISIVSDPIVSTVTIYSTRAVTSTVGYTTIHGSGADVVVSAGVPESFVIGTILRHFLR